MTPDRIHNCLRNTGITGFVCVALTHLTSAALLADASLLTLWYDKPAAKWDDALPVGNGRLGAMVFGGTAEERLQLNESTLWGGLPQDYANPEAGPHLAELRRLIFAGKIPEAERLGGQMLGKPPFQVPYQPLGDLHLRFPGHDKVDHYVRSLDLDRAMATTIYRIGEIEFKREVFVSFPDQAIVMRLSCSKPGQLAFEVRLDTPHPGILTQVAGKNTLRLAGQLPPRAGSENWSAGWEQPGLKFEARLRVLLDGGVIESEAGHLNVRDANSATLVFCAATSFKNYRDVSADSQMLVERQLVAACGKSSTQLQQNHLSDYQLLFRRVAVDLGTSPAAALPTDRRIANFTKAGDPALVALYYQFGRYLLLASSRPGGQPANLQGIWNQELWPSWSSKWTCNINVEMNYWAAETANLAECHQPLFDLIDDLRVAGQKTAKDWYNCRGFVVHHNTDLWRGTAPVDGVQGVWPMGGVWLVQHLWEHYAFSGDKEFLRQRAYPAMKDAAQFMLDFLTEAPAGTAFPGALVTNPSYSPENTYKLPNGAGARFTYAATLDLELIGDLFERCIAASNILGVDKEFREQLGAAQRRLPPLQIGKAGQLQEWIGDWDMQAPERKHRHVSHLYAMMPGQRITPRETPRFAAAVRKSLELRGDGGMGWSKAWKIGLWARLLEGDHALSMVEDLIKGSTLPNMLDNGPPFQIDGNFGGCAGIGEMLLQSQAAGESTLDDSGGKLAGVAGEMTAIQLLPALPAAWPDGSVRGMCARSGFEVDVAWREGKLTEATLRSKQGGPCRIFYQDKAVTLTTKPGQTCCLNGKLGNR
ncbi:MAG: glycoside hydrolase family 95 protein [Verrucomicrobiota bacterium]